MQFPQDIDEDPWLGKLCKGWELWVDIGIDNGDIDVYL